MFSIDKKIGRYALSILAGLCLISAASAQVPQALAGKQIRIIVPQTAGGASDAIARIMGQEFSKRWGVPVVVENRPGAGGITLQNRPLTVQPG